MIFSILAFVALIVSIIIKDRKKSLIVQSINCLFEAIYAFVISAYTGAVLGIINVIRSSLFINKQKFTKSIYLFVLMFFESIIIFNCIVTWEGYISLLPTIGSIIRTYCLWQSNMKLVRLSAVITGIFYGSYYFYYKSWIMVFGDLILLITGIIALCKNDIKKKNKKLKNR